MTRFDGRTSQELRPITFELGIQPASAGSVLLRWGQTHIICSASVEDRVPSHRLQSGGGWLTAEYAMLPGSSGDRIRRDRNGPSGRTAEIQRLIGRSLRSVFDLNALGQRTMRIDCDVLNADGGTRCASITAAYVVGCLGLAKIAQSDGKALVLPPKVAAVSVGVCETQVLCDLCYQEDSTAQVDLNYVASPQGLVEVQGTAEGAPFSRDVLNSLLDLGQQACTQLFRLQDQVLQRAGVGT